MEDMLAEQDALLNHGLGIQRQNPLKYNSSSAHISGNHLYNNVEYVEREREFTHWVSRDEIGVWDSAMLFWYNTLDANKLLTAT